MIPRELADDKVEVVPRAVRHVYKLKLHSKDVADSFTTRSSQLTMQRRDPRDGPIRSPQARGDLSFHARQKKRAFSTVYMPSRELLK
eukprot:2688090-Pyramimonas_sp.AAC.1